MAEKDTVVLARGSWLGRWSWDPLVPLLEQAGHRVETVDLPGRDDPFVAARSGLAEFVAAVVDVVKGVGEPVTLVGHSMGGITVTAVADRFPEHVARLLYVAAFVPGPGQTLADLAAVPEFAPSLALRQEVDPETGLSTYPADLAVQAFFGETEGDVAAAAARRLVPDTVALLIEPAAPASARPARVPRAYVECLRDRAIPVEAQRVMYRAAGIGTVFTLDTDHSPFLSRPTELCAAVDELVRTS
jgi:pimeloyl-ACP methyl ester carboxylesterase